MQKMHSPAQVHTECHDEMKLVMDDSFILTVTFEDCSTECFGTLRYYIGDSCDFELGLEGFFGDR